MGNKISELKHNIQRRRYRYSEVVELNMEGVNALVLPTPQRMLSAYPLNENCKKFVASHRNILREILGGEDKRRVIFIGKKFVSPMDFDDFVDTIAVKRSKEGDVHVVVVHLTFDHELEKVRRSCRRALKKKVALGFNLTCAILGQYFGDMACCVTVETMYNAGMASASSSPAICSNEAICQATQSASTFVGVSHDGQICAFQTDGNPHSYTLGKDVITSKSAENITHDKSVFVLL